MTTTLDELVTPMTVDEAKAAIYDALAARGVVTTVWKPGAVVRTIIAALAIVLAGLSSVQSQLAKMGFLDFASGVWLTMVARYVYGVERLEATFATGTILATNAGGNVYSGAEGDLIVSASGSNSEYRASESWTIGAFAVDVEIDIAAVIAGTDSSVGASGIDTIVTSLAGVTVTNPFALIATDVESDTALRQRCRDSIGALSPNGPTDAYRYVARTAVRDDGTSIGVTRVRTIPDGYGNVAVYLATATGGITGDPFDPLTDLGAVALAIETQCVPICVTAQVQSADALTLNVVYEIWVRDTIGMTADEVTTLVAAGLEDFVSTTPIGGEVIPPDGGMIYLDAVRACIASSLPNNTIVKLIVTDPATDAAVAENEAPVLGLVACSDVHFVTGALA